MLTDAALILLIVPFFVGIGLLFPGLSFRRTPTPNGFLAAFWCGWAMAIAFLQVWHLFFPVTAPALPVLFALSLVGWALARTSLKSVLSGLKRPKTLVLLALAVIPALIVANHVMFVPAHFDHGLYHLQTVKWIENYAIVPGLGNLHHRLAFNNSNLLVAALLNAGFLFGRSFYLSNTLLAYVLILQCLTGFYKFFRPDGPGKNTDLYYALMTPLILWQISTTHLAGYSPDIPVFVLQAVLGGELLRLWEPDLDKTCFSQQAALVVLLAAAGITVKMSFAVFGALVLLGVYLTWLIRFRFNPRTDGRTWLVWLVPAAFLVLVWMIRSAILTGYPFYPSTFLPLALPWRMPADLVDQAAAVISTWARTRSSSIPYTADLAWLQNWYRLFTFEARQAFTFALALAGLDALLLFFTRKRVQADPGSLILFAISLLSLVFWFIMAPDYRFSGANFWILLVSTVLFGYSLLTQSQLVSSPRFLALAALLVLAVWISPNHFSNNLSRKLLINPILEPVVAAQAMQNKPISSRETASGLLVYIPTGNTGECWDAPLPCTPKDDLISRLSLLQPGDLQKGFYIASGGNGQKP